MEKSKLTVIMAITNEESFEESVASYLSAKDSFKDVKIIATDLTDDEADKEIIRQVVDENSDSVSLISCEPNLTREEFYAQQKALVREGFVCFTESTVVLQISALKFLRRISKRRI